MDPLLPPLPTPSGHRPAKPTEPLPALDIAAYSGGPAAVFATQLFSKSHPHLAAEVAGNVLGPKLNVYERRHGITPTNAALLLAPAPAGFVDPTNYGLQPNYTYGLESRARQIGFGLDKLLPPPSTLLHNLPDYDPRVRYEQYRVHAKEQRREVAKFAISADVNDVIDLIELTKGDIGPRIFFDPAEIERELIVSGANKAGGLDKFRAAQLARNVSEGQRFLPRPGSTTGRIPSALDPLPAPPLRTITYGGGTADLMADLERNARRVPPLNTPPTNNQQREAMGRAPELLRELVTERSDP